MPVRQTSKKARRRSRPARESLLDKLKRAKLQFVTLTFRDGRVLNGTLVYNEIKSTGRLINAEKEFSVDFHLGEVKNVRF